MNAAMRTILAVPCGEMLKSEAAYRAVVEANPNRRGPKRSQGIGGLVTQPLTVVTEESIAGRTIVYNNSGSVLMIRGKLSTAPDLVCGKCMAVLVQGVSRGQFIDPTAAQAVGIHYIRLTPPIGGGPIFISGPFPIKTATDHVEAVVLCWPACRGLNDTVSDPV
jgi:hypothetical protein